MYQMGEKKPQSNANRLKERVPEPKPKVNREKREVNKEEHKSSKAEEPKPPRPKRKFHFIGKLVVLFLCAVGLVAGMAIGYSYIGHQPLSDVWKRETWQHVYDLIFAP
jgi:hypothetical protein